jgi:hypothetical protein
MKQEVSDFLLLIPLFVKEENERAERGCLIKFTI